MVTPSVGWGKPDNDRAYSRNPQSLLFASDLYALRAGGYDTGVISGCGVVAGGGMKSTVASGVVLSLGVHLTVSSGDLTHANADPVLTRIDLVVVDSSGTKRIRRGSAQLNPKPAWDLLQNGDVILATVTISPTITVLVGGTGSPDDPSNMYDDSRWFLSRAHLLLTGRSGGQTAIFGSDSGDGGILTSNPAENGSIYVDAVQGAPNVRTSFGIRDVTPYAVGVGGRIDFLGVYNSVPQLSRFGGIAGVKENSGNGSTAGQLWFYTNPGSNEYLNTIPAMTITSGNLVAIQGGSSNIDALSTPKRLLISEGSVSSPITATDTSAVVVTRYMTADGAGDSNAGVWVHVINTGSLQPVAHYGLAQNYGSGDACAFYGVADHHGSGVAYAAFFDATAQGTGSAIAVQALTANLTGVDRHWATLATVAMIGYDNAGGGNADLGPAFLVRSNAPDNGGVGKWSHGIIFSTAAGPGDIIAVTTILDESSAPRSLDIRGSHVWGADFSSGTFSSGQFKFDANSYLLVEASQVTFQMDSQDYYQFVRADSSHRFYVANSIAAAVLGSGFLVAGYERIGSSSSPPANTTAGDLTFVRAFVNDDSNFSLAVVSSNPRLTWDSGDYMYYDRTSNIFNWIVGTVGAMSLLQTGGLVNGYWRAGSLSVPNNTTAGDITGVRMNIGNTAFVSGAGVQFEANAIIKGYLAVGSSVAAPSHTSAGDFTAINHYGTIMDASTGYRVGGAATSGHVLRGNGTNFVDAALSASDIASGAALTKTDDTNVTATLGGTPTAALLAAASITLGWTGQLAVSRGGIGVGTLASNGVLYGNGTGAVQALAVNASATNKFLTQSSSGAPAWGTIVAGDISGLAPTWTAMHVWQANAGYMVEFQRTAATAQVWGVAVLSDGSLDIDTVTGGLQCFGIDTSGHVYLKQDPGIAQLATNGSGKIINAVSDRRLKYQIEPLPYGMAEVRAIDPQTFYFLRSEDLGDRRRAGFVAQDVEPHIPEAVYSSQEGKLGIEDRPLIATLWRAMQEKDDEIQDLKRRVDDLTAAAA